MTSKIYYHLKKKSNGKHKTISRYSIVISIILSCLVLGALIQNQDIETVFSESLIKQDSDPLKDMDSPPLTVEQEEPNLEYFPRASSGNTIHVLNPFPLNGEVIGTINLELSVYVNDTYSNLLNVSFYNASDASLIKFIEDVPSDSRVFANWSNLGDQESYSWYVNVSNGVEEIQSEIYSFQIDFQEILMNDIIEEILEYNLNVYSEKGYYPTIHPPSLHATYYALYSLNAINKLDQVNTTAILDFIMSYYDSESGTFSDPYSNRYLDTDLEKKNPAPLTSELQVNCYAVLSLSILGELNQIDTQKMEDYLWSCFHVSEGGFLGQPVSGGLSGIMALPTADNTFFAVQALDCLISEWSGYLSEKNKIILYLKDLQSSESGINLGGFNNEEDDDYKSLIIDETNMLAAYYCVKTLDLWDATFYIDSDDFESWLEYLYNPTFDYFVIAPQSKYLGTDYYNIVATAMGLELAEIMGYTFMNTNEILTYLTSNRNNMGIWDKSIDIPYHEVLYTYQILRSLNDAGHVDVLDTDSKQEIANGTQHFMFYKGFSIMSADYTSQDKLNSLVNAFYNFDIENIGSLDGSYIFEQIKDAFFSIPSIDYYQMHSFTGYDGVEPDYFTRPVEYKTVGTHERVHEFNDFCNQRAMYLGLDTLYQLDMLDEFETETGVSASDLIECLLSSQFLEMGYSGTGGFSPDVSNVYFDNEHRNAYIYPEHSFYAIKSLELLAKYSGVGPISDLSLDTTALANYLLSLKEETSSEIKFIPSYTSKPAEVLETTFQSIYILSAIDEFGLNTLKIKNYMESQLAYSNLEQLYYCYKINEILDLGITFEKTAVRQLINSVYSEELKDFFSESNKNATNHRYLPWITEMGLMEPYSIAADYSTDIPLGTYALVMANFTNLIYDKPLESIILKFESANLPTHEFHEDSQGMYYCYVYIPSVIENYPSIDGFIRAYEESEALLDQLPITLTTTSNPPNITILSPSEGEVFGPDAPEFSIALEGTDINEKWYTFNEETEKYYFTTEPTIDQTAWNDLPEGFVIIKFHASNCLDDYNTDEVSVYKKLSSPSLSIQSPDNNELFGSNSPEFQITITDPYLDETWYVLDDGITITDKMFFEYLFETQISQTKWNLMDNGTVNITFFANDTLGNVASQEVGVHKDIFSPEIIVNSPEEHSIFATPPTLDVSVVDANLEGTWYQLNDSSQSSTEIPFDPEIPLTIDSDAWNSMEEGMITISIMANDTMGNERIVEWELEKDTTAPLITISTPQMNALFGIDSPSFDMTIDAMDLSKTWYTLYDGQTMTEKIFFEYLIDTSISQTEWNAMNNGTVYLTFYANDTLSNQAFETIILHKDSLPPVITVNCPQEYTNHSVAPILDLLITDSNLNETWYQLQDSILATESIYFDPSNPIQLDEDSWNSLEDSLITIIIHANDTLGNEQILEWTIRKDQTPPIITLVSPENGSLQGANAPFFDILIDAIDLNTTWYILNNSEIQTDKIFFEYSVDIMISQADWELMGNGTVTITFYANDTTGNIAYGLVTIYKDIISPEVTLITPIEGEVFNSTSPSIEVEVLEADFTIATYQLTDGTHYSNIYPLNPKEVVQLSQEAWELMDDGQITIMVNVSDQLYNWRVENFLLEKDSLTPEIDILYPEVGDYFSGEAPQLLLDVEDPHLDEIWYEMIQGELIFIRILDPQQAMYIYQEDWNLIEDGMVILTIHANDTLENKGFETISIFKDSTILSITIHRPLENSVTKFAPYFNISLSKEEISHVWYILNDGITQTDCIYIDYGADDRIDIGAWSILQHGQVALTFYANDTIGNQCSKMIHVYKDLEAPVIIINTPTTDDFLNASAFFFTLDIQDYSLNTTWYRLINTSNPAQAVSECFDLQALNRIDQDLWNIFQDGNIIFQVHANDTFGHQSFMEITIKKDKALPYISLIEPISQEFYGVYHPWFEFDYFEPNIESAWYVLSEDGISWTTSHSLIDFFGTVDTQGYIETEIWDDFDSGLVYIRFCIEDEAENIGMAEVIVQKDIITPFVTILSPWEDQAFNDVPSFKVRVIETNILEMWYRIDSGLQKIYFTENGSLNPSKWLTLTNKEVRLDFYVRDQAGNMGEDTVYIYKDTIEPEIMLSGFSEASLYGLSPPSITIAVDDLHLNETWYIIDVNGQWSENVYFEEIADIDSPLWIQCENGSVYIRFFAEDTAGNSNFEEVRVWKDIIAPQITINSPSSCELFGSIPPNFNVSVFDHQFEEVFYVLRNFTYPDIRSSFISFTPNTNVTIDLNAWQLFGNGSIYLEFHAIDSLGNVNKRNVTLFKDILGPLITLSEGYLNELYGPNAPLILIDFLDNNYLDAKYWLEDAINITERKNAPKNVEFILNQQDWLFLANSTIYLYIEAVDILNNNNQICIPIERDILGPIIEIHDPIENALFSFESPEFSATFVDVRFELCWYRVMSGDYESEWIDFIPGAQFELPMWSMLSNGTVFISVRANDTFGNVNLKTIKIYKDILSPIIEFETLYDNTYCGINTPSIIMNINESNMQSVTYKLYNDSVEISGEFNLEHLENIEGLSRLETIIPENEWHLFGNGSLTLVINASDLMENKISFKFTLQKELSIPALTIQSPLNDTLCGIQAPSFQLSLEGKILDSYWYVLNNSLLTFESNHYSASSNVQSSIEQSLWSQFGNESITITFVVRNEAGNTFERTIMIQKDNFAPIITILEPIIPEQQELVQGKKAPKYNITVEDWNLESVWYTLSENEQKFYLTSGQYAGTINQDAWNLYENATLSINFYAMDSVGNIQQESFTVRKEIFESETSSQGGSGEEQKKDSEPENPSIDPRTNEDPSNPLVTLPLAFSMIVGPGLVIGISVLLKRRLPKVI